MSAAPSPFFTSYRQRFDACMSARREPDKILKQRRAAFQILEKQGLPTRKQEAWRFTDLSAVQNTLWQRPEATPVAAENLPQIGKASTLTFINGRFSAKHSRLRGLPDKALVASLNQALLTHPELLEPHLDRLPGLQQHPFAALNSALWEDGAFVYVPRGAELTTPIHLIFQTIGEQIAAYPRLLVVLERASEATLVVEYGGQGAYLNAPTAELVVGKGATLHYCHVQEEAPHALHLGVLRLRQEQSSQAHVHLLAFGGQLARVDVDALLDGEHAHCDLNGLTLARQQQASTFQVRVEHAQPHCHSEQYFKSVLEDKASSVFDGLAYVRQHAQKTEAHQISRNLLLSRHAHAHSNPRLEILADDVKCGHGSSTGFLDPDAEFYLRSRGIPQAQARALLVQAFANDSLQRIPLEALRERLANVLAARLALQHIEEAAP